MYDNIRVYNISPSLSLSLCCIQTSKTTNKSQAIPNPCMLSGANLTYHSDHIYTECTRQTCSGVFATGFSPPALSSWEEEEEIEFNFTGSGNFTQCREIIEELFDLTNCSRSGECEDKDYFWPPVNNSGTFLVCLCVCVCVCVCIVLCCVCKILYTLTNTRICSSLVPRPSPLSAHYTRAGFVHVDSYALGA